LSYGLFRVGGMPMLVAGGAAVVTAAMALVYRLMVGPAARRFWLMLLALPLASCVWALRPQILTLLLLAGLLWLVGGRSAPAATGRGPCCSWCGPTPTAPWRWAGWR